MCICNLIRNFVCLISTDMFPRKFVDYNTSSCAYSHTKRHVSAHFLTYKVMSLRYIQHLTPFLSPNFPLMYLKRCTHDFNLQLLLTMQLLTYKTSSHRWTCLYVNICMSPNFLCSISTITFPHKRVNTLRGNMVVEIKHRKLCGTSCRRHVCVET